MTTPTFRQPGQADQQPTGECPDCGGVEIPLTSRRNLAEHVERRVRRNTAGDPEHYETNVRCPGSGHPAEKGTTTRPRQQRTWRGTAAGKQLRGRAATQHDTTEEN